MKRAKKYPFRPKVTYDIEYIDPGLYSRGRWFVGAENIKNISHSVMVELDIPQKTKDRVLKLIADAVDKKLHEPIFEMPKINPTLLEDLKQTLDKLHEMLPPSEWRHQHMAELEYKPSEWKFPDVECCPSKRHVFFDDSNLKVTTC